MKLAITECLCIDHETRGLVVVDSLHPVTGKGIYGGRSEGDTYEGEKLYRCSLDEAAERIDAHASTDPVPCTEDEYNEMLNVLPPMRWENGGFAVCEALTGSIHAFYVRRHRRYWSLNTSIGRPWSEILAAVDKAHAELA